MGSLIEEEYLAKPSGECCLKGHLHQGEPRGTFKTVADVETYIVEPRPGKSNGHILLYFPDVWGMFPNGLLIMDGFADAGYLTLGLDYFRGVRELPQASALLRCADLGFRILYGSIERIATITPIRILITRPGNEST